MIFWRRIYVLVEMNRAFVEAACEQVPDDGRTLWNLSAAAYFMGGEL